MPSILVEPADWVIIKEILTRIVPNVEIWAFGSRVNGKLKKFSDLDLVIKSEYPISISILGNLKQAFFDSDLPFKVDIIDWASTTPEFKHIISEKYVVIQPEANHL